MKGRHWMGVASRWGLRWLLAVLLACAGASHVAHADGGFTVRAADTTLRGKLYYLDALIDWDFSKDTLQALRNGVPLTVELDIEILRPRDYVWDETVIVLYQRYQLRYQALTQRYVVHNLNSGAQSDYANLELALATLGRITDLPLVDRDLLDPDEAYTARLRASLDLEALPVPLRLLGYVSPSWRLSSEWYTWPLR